MLRWRREKMRKRERGEAGCKLTAAFDTRTKKFRGKNKWAIF